MKSTSLYLRMLHEFYMKFYDFKLVYGKQLFVM